MATVAIAFDTHRYVKCLTGAGMDERQAEVLAEEQVALLNANLATKADLAAVDANLQAKIAELDRDLRATIAEVDRNLQARIAAVKV